VAATPLRAPSSTRRARSAAHNARACTSGRVGTIGESAQQHTCRSWGHAGGHWQQFQVQEAAASSGRLEAVLCGSVAALWLRWAVPASHEIVLLHPSLAVLVNALHDLQAGQAGAARKQAHQAGGQAATWAAEVCMTAMAQQRQAEAAATAAAAAAHGPAHLVVPLGPHRNDHAPACLQDAHQDVGQRGGGCRRGETMGSGL
jgi:hypothetical protein